VSAPDKRHENPSPDRPRDALIAEYGQVNENFRLLTDIRFKLLAFLPIAAAVGAAVVKASSSGTDPLSDVGALAISLFGLAVTVGLVTYNDRNDQLYDTLVGRAATIERELALPDGAFAHRPYPWFTIDLGLFAWKVEHRNAVNLIYCASIALWLAGFLSAAARLVAGPDTPGVVYGASVGAAIAVTLLGRSLIARQRKKRRQRMRQDVYAAVRFVNEHGRKPAADCKAFCAACAGLLGAEADGKAKSRAAFYANLDDDRLSYYMPIQPDDDVAAAHFVALITDLPPGWIHDIAQKRRGTAVPPLG